MGTGIGIGTGTVAHVTSREGADTTAAMGIDNFSAATDDIPVFLRSSSRNIDTTTDTADQRI